MTVMIATDENAYDVIVKAGFVAIPPNNHTISPQWGGRQGRHDHSYVNNLVWLSAIEILSLGYELILHDVDTVWKKNPLPFLRNVSTNLDVLTQLAPVWTMMGTANTGFVYLKCNARVMAFVQTLINLIPIKETSDQRLFNTVLRHHKMRQIRWMNLPDRLFPRLLHRKSSKNYPHALMGHAVSNSKTRKLTSVGMYYFNESCTVYNESLDVCKGLDMKDCNL